MIDWNEVVRWLKEHGHMNDSWDCVEVGEDSFYAEDNAENTIISLFTRAGGELIVFVGCRRPNISVGGSTGVFVESYLDVLDWLFDNLEPMYDELMEKIMKEVSQ